MKVIIDSVVTYPRALIKIFRIQNQRKKVRNGKLINCIGDYLDYW